MKNLQITFEAHESLPSTSIRRLESFGAFKVCGKRTGENSRQLALFIGHLAPFLAIFTLHFFTSHESIAAFNLPQAPHIGHLNSRFASAPPIRL